MDWGNLARTVLDYVDGPADTITRFLPAPQQQFVGAQMPPQTVTVNTQTGKVTACKRRRRRRLLTPTDLSDLAALKTIVGNTDALKFAVTKAVRR